MIIKAPRLILKQESLHDFERFYAMSIDPQVMQYIGDGSVYHWNRAVALKKFTQGFCGNDQNEFRRLAVYRTDGYLYIGWCGIGYSKFLDHIELGYRYCRDSWRKGYATEAAAAILAEIYQHTEMNEIFACAHPANTASIRVLEKLGFQYAYVKLSKPVGKEIPVYKIDRNAFL